MTLTGKQRQAIVSACYQLTHCNGYNESNGDVWIAQPIYQILDALGVPEEQVFDMVACVECGASRELDCICDDLNHAPETCSACNTI